ncbi:hypothetical protein HNR42_001247 [Deinobacterium chartae]|uniref:Uncharacterized protein n=1 Tax=Deinobacterium chartae TaxID=521158 RepID=A0A841HYT1_9DEIO|nr:hypothetical protein [Deinobacterium chartae]MBB6097824.1 hypothetical protein [Deinobacterium chartae]
MQPVQTKTHKLTCRWVPGTLNRVVVEDESGSYEVALDRLERQLGRTVSHDLYLKGRADLEVMDDAVINLTRR